MEWKFELTEKEFQQCDKFADDSSKSQREHRSGGILQRDIKKIKEDTLRGKIGEVIVKKFLEQVPFNIKGISLDFGVYDRGIWDETDIEINKKKISIKSSKSFAKWLLLESKDIKRGDLYDYYILVLIDKDFKAGVIKGFASKDEIIKPNDKTLLLKQEEFIPNTSTSLDADNHARHSDNLHNSEEDWEKIIRELKKVKP